MNLKTVLKYFAAGLVLSAGVYLFFYEPINSYFSQDDFFHMRAIMEKSFSDIPSFFMSEQEEYAFYRPLSRETYNLLMYQFFGLNSFVFHLINLGLIILNGFLIYRFFKMLGARRISYVLAIVLYFFSAVHSIELYYLASFQTLLAASFVLLALISYLKFLKEKRNNFWFLALILFLFGITSHESSVVLIGLVAVLEILLLGFGKKQIINLFLHMLPFLFILCLRFLIHYFGAGLDQQQTYNPSFNPKDIVNTFAWFTLWSFGMPEMLVDFATLTLNFNPNLFKFYPDYVGSVFPLFALILFSLLLVIVSLVYRNFKDRSIWFLGLGYVISLAPFLLFPNHKFVYYLTIPILFFCGFCGVLLGKYWGLGNSHKFLIVTFIVAYIVISYQTINLNKITHWAAKRANSANFLINDLKQKYAGIPEGSVFYIKNDPEYPFIAKEWGTSSKQAFYILSGDDAFKLLFKDPSVKAYYEDVTGPPEENNLEKLIIYEARFPY